MVKVAIIDTGIDLEHEYLKENIIGGIAFECKDNYIISSDEYRDYNGHGTACASIIKREFNDVELFSIKALDKNGKTNIQVLEEALKYTLKTDIRIINLSLSVIDSQMVNDLYKICTSLSNNGKIIICSLANVLEKSYPAVFDNVIGVKGFILNSEDSFWYNKDYDIQCIMDNNLHLAAYPNNSYRLFGKSNSQAAAKLTGKVANIISKNPNMGFFELQNKLEEISVKSSWIKNDLYRNKKNLEFNPKLYSNDNKLIIKLSNLLSNIFDIEDIKILYDTCLFDKKIGLNYINAFEIIKCIEKSFNIKLNYMSISGYNLISIYTLASLIEEYIN